jgi:hypothetical protein
MASATELVEVFGMVDLLGYALQELVDEVTVAVTRLRQVSLRDDAHEALNKSRLDSRSVQFDTIKPSLLTELGGVLELFQDSLQVLLGDDVQLGLALLVGGNIGHCRDVRDVARVCNPSEEDELAEDDSTLGMHAVVDLLPHFSLFRGKDTRSARVATSGFRDDGGFRDDQPALTRSLGIVFGRLVTGNPGNPVRSKTGKRSHGDTVGEVVWAQQGALVQAGRGSAIPGGERLVLLFSSYHCNVAEVVLLECLHRYCHQD